jgi:threonyl-tRNA synthetase
LATNQVDFAIPKRFGLTFTDEGGREQTPLCIHRAPLSTHERFVGFLIEHFGGDFPLWLAPVQVAVLPVSDKVIDYARNVETTLKEAGIRVQLNGQPDKVGAKIRQAELQRINVMLVVGEKEVQNNQVALRRRFKGDLGTQLLDDVVTELKTEIETRRNTYRTN